MLSSLADTTIKQYNFVQWQFCKQANLNPFNSYSDSVIFNFLNNQFEHGAAYGSLNIHRSALALLLNRDLGSNRLIKRFFKGIYRLRPALPKYVATWDPQKVLDHVAQWKPHDSICLEKLTKKLTVLLALCTAHRAKTLSYI